MKHTITEIVKDNRRAFIKYIRQGLVYYTVCIFEETEYHLYTFPISISDLGEATLNSEEKALLLMRYIRKAIEDKTMAYSKFKT